MADWEIYNITVVDNAWNRASAEMMANELNGTVQMAYADLNIPEIKIDQGYAHITRDTTTNDAPVITWSDCNYIMIGLYYGGYYTTGFKFVFFEVTDETATFKVNFGGGDGGCGGLINILHGDGFTAFKQTGHGTSDNAVFVYSNVTDLATGDSVKSILNSSMSVDIDNGIVAETNVISFKTIAQTDGTDYVEVIKPVYIDKSDGTGEHIYQPDNVFFAMYDYDSGRDKNILINGIKMNRMMASSLYVPTE
jgi:hypothetical protein